MSQVDLIQHVFADVAGRFAERIACQADDRSLTYRELAGRAEGMADQLQARGLGKGSIVAILTSDPFQLIESILGVLRAGAAFMPLEPSWPRRRLAALRAEVGPDLVLLEPGLDLPGPQVMTLGDGARPATSPRFVAYDVDDFCYVYFTSGSTGRPKGVMGRLGSIGHFVRWEIETFGIDEETRGSQLHAPSFDASLRDFFVPLCAGGTVCFPPRKDGVLDVAALAAWIDRQKIHLIHAVPSLFRALLDEQVEATKLASLKTILLAGETLYPEDVRRWRESYGDRAEIINLYGPSETTMTKLFHRVTEKDLHRPLGGIEGGSPRRDSIPIGRPMPGARAIVVDEEDRPCGSGRAGEILIRTPHRSLGYFGREELTRESFVPNPFGDDPSDLVYRTGDRGRRREDGTFEFLGRLDQQVKIRGVRIELGEVEGQLRTLPAVRDAVVVERQDARKEKHLVAYVVAPEAGDTDYRTALGEWLPEGMIPSRFLRLDRIPRTASGKVDPAALPDPFLRRSQPVAARTDLEKRLLAIYQEVLDAAEIGIEDSFFDLGGHSLLVMRLLARIRNTLGVELSPGTVFDRPSVAELAGSVAAALPKIDDFRSLTGDGSAPLSFAQQRLWFLSRLHPRSAFYNMAGGLRIQGPLSFAALYRSLAEIVRRHQVLRSTFSLQDDHGVQLLAASFDLPLPRVDLRRVPAADRESEAQRRLHRQARRPFDLARGPVLRTTLFQLADDEHLLLVVMHHAVADLRSVTIFAEELGTLYSAFAHGAASPLPELAVQYADFAVRQRRWARGPDLERLWSYWKRQLGSLDTLELPTDRPRPIRPSLRGETLPFTLPRGLSPASSRRSTPFVTLLAVFKVLLFRWTGQRKIVLGTAVEGREHQELEGLIGCFVNTVVLASEIAGDLSFEEVLERVRERAVGAFNHQTMPFEELLHRLRPELDDSHASLFQVAFASRNALAPVLSIEGARALPFTVETGSAKLDLLFFLDEIGPEITGAVEYSRELFDRTTILRLLEQYGRLWEGILARPSLPVARLPLLGAAQGQQVLREWNATGTRWQDRCFHHLFEEQARRRPEAVATVFRTGSLTYRDLDRRANHLAHLLVRQGVGGERVVGVDATSAVDLVVAFLAVLKAGAAYLPLDPSLPPARIDAMIKDSGATLLSSLKVTGGAEDAGPALEIDADRLAYVIYTSGSSGQPKGTWIEHRGLVNLAKAQVRAFGVGPESAVLQFAVPSFDASISEIAMALASGATLHLAPRDALTPGPPLLRRLREDRISVVTLPPSALAVMSLDDLPDLRSVIFAGEPCSSDVLAKAAAPGRRLFNAYGPTEDSVCSTIWEATSGTVPLGGNTVIGPPIANHRTYVLDRGLEPSPIGAFGELCLAGVGLTRGYLGRPALTAEKLVPHPFGGQPGERLYKSGDQVRLRPDGEIEFRGRIDSQVKLRGHRVELGEIEARLCQNPGVREAAVIVQGDGPEDLHLVAYVVPENGGEPCQEALRDDLRRHLPSYMVPSFFVSLEDLPRTPSRKIDRRALPALGEGAQTARRVLTAPRDSWEHWLHGIWHDLLHARHFGVTDDFFDLGGNSLLAVSMTGRIEKELDKELPLSAGFAGMTIEKLAVTLRQKASSRTASSLVCLAKGTEGEKRPPLYCVHPIGGNVLGYLALSRHMAPDQPFYAFAAPGVGGRREPFDRIEDLAAHFLTILRSEAEEGPCFLAGHSFGGLVAFEMARQLRATGREVAFVGLLDTPAPAPVAKDVPRIDDVEWLLREAELLQDFFGGEPHQISRPRLEALEEDVRLDVFLEEMKKARLLPPDANRRLIRGVLKVRKASHRALHRYRPSRSYAGPLDLFVAGRPEAVDATLGWQGRTTGPVAVHEVPGDHITMLTEPHVRTLAKSLQACLDEAAEAPPLDPPKGTLLVPRSG